MFDLNLPIFPEHSTAATVTITVWIGVCVVVFFNLRFGWTLSGLVTPGYLVPLLLVKPVAVAIIVGEAIVTYLISRQLSDYFSRRWFWSSFFGRDRFLAIVLTSILVRAGADGWLLPRFGAWINGTFGLQIDYRNDLHSYGLIVVALLANYFWKPGLLRGGWATAVTVGITYGVMRFVVLEMTNLNLGSLHYLYDDMSTSLLSSPKAYVLVITTAFVASQMNLRYSWDFNGILVPSLLGLLWHAPEKIAVTFVESAWILLVATVLLRLPIWRRVTVEGGRKLCVFFTITALHRLLIAHLMPLFSEAHITDAYGFGYLLTTLMAIKAHDKQIPIRVWRATLQTSMMGATVGSMLGYGLSYLPAEMLVRPPVAPLSIEQAAAADSYDSMQDLWSLLSSERVRLYATMVPGSYQVPLPNELRAFRRGVEQVLEFAQTDDPALLLASRESLAVANYEIQAIEDRYYVLHEHVNELSPARGWGTFIIDRQSQSTLLVEVPAPLEEWATLESGYSLFSLLNARTLAIGGTARDTNPDRSSDILARRASMIAEFHRVVGGQDVLQVRGWTPQLVTRLLDARASDAQQTADAMESQLFVKRSMPAGVNIAIVSDLANVADVQWRDTPLPNVLRDQTPRGFAELVLSQYDRRIIRSRLFASSEPSLPNELMPIQDGHLTGWLVKDRETVARQGSEAYEPAVVEEMLFLDNEVVRPLVALGRKVDRFEASATAGPDGPRTMTLEHNQQLRAIEAAAASLDYQLTLFHDLSSDQDYFVLHETQPKLRNWGTFVFRVGLDSPYVVEVPRPLYERQTHVFGGILFQRLESSALLIAGAHPFANAEGTADVTRMANRVNAYQLIRQVLMREFSSVDMLFIQARAIQSPVDADVVIATDDGTSRLEDLSPATQDVIEALERDELTIRLVDGSEDTAGYELGIHFQAWVLNQADRKRMVSLWLSPTVRLKLRQSETMRLAAAQMEAIGVPTVEKELTNYLRQLGTEPALALAPDAREAMLRFRENSDVVHLYQVQQSYPNYRMTRLVDVASDQVFVLLQTQDGKAPVVFNMSCLKDEEVQLDAFTDDAIRDFVRSRAYSLEVRSSR